MVEDTTVGAVLVHYSAAAAWAQEEETGYLDMGDMVRTGVA